MVANKSLVFKSILVVATLAVASIGSASPTAITYQGRILKPDGSPLSGSAVRFRFQIRSPDPTDCLMYEEISAAHDMSESKGQFSLSLGDGSGTGTNLQISDTGGANAPLTLGRALTNNGNFGFQVADCNGTNTYTPAASDGRVLAVAFRDETMSTWEPIPTQKINSVPYAFAANQVEGYGANSLVRVNGAGGVPATNISPLSNAEYQKLLDLIDGTSTVFEKAGQFGGAAMPLTSSLSSGQVLSWNGTAWAATTLAQWSVAAPGINYLGASVGIGTTTPVAKLNVSGGSIVSDTQTNGALVTTIDFSKGNVQTSSHATGNPAMNLCGLADGGSYTLVLTAQPNGSTPVFSVFSDAACAVPITHLDTGGIPLTTSSATTLITFIRAGSTVYAMLATGFVH